MRKISVVISTLNEEENIKRAIDSVKWADEILVCDMHSGDKTVETAKSLGAKIVSQKKVNFVEPARNFAISKATSDWVLILDPDEEISKDLAKRLKEMILKPINSTYVEIPRKNIIFGKWIKHSGWWPDYQIRFFKKGSVVWNNAIHSKPQTKGLGLTLQAEEKWAIIHHNYQTISQFIARMNRYSDIEASQLHAGGYKFYWQDLLEKPLNEFLARFFVKKGYQDGLHGLGLSLLQAFSFLLVYLKLWEKSGFKEQDIKLDELKQQKNKSSQAIEYWFKQTTSSGNLIRRLFKK